MASPNPEKELARLDDLLRGDCPRVLLLQGPARWFRDRALAAVRSTLGRSGDVIELDGNESGGAAAEAATFLMDLRSPSLFGGGRVLLLRNAERWLKQHGAVLADTLSRIVSGNTLVLLVSKIDGRTALAKRIRKHGAVFEFRNLYEKPFGHGRAGTSAEIVQWLVARGRTHGVTLDPGAALFMVEVVGADPGALDGELVRLGPTLSGGRVSADTLRGALTVSFGSTQFELVDAILDRDARLALRSLRAMFREGLRDKDGKLIERSAIFPMASAWLRQSLGKLLEARAALDAGAPRGSVVAQFGGYFRERFERQLGRRSTHELIDILGALRRAERRLRATGEESEVLLERLVCETLLPIRHGLASLETRRW